LIQKQINRIPFSAASKQKNRLIKKEREREREREKQQKIGEKAGITKGRLENAVALLYQLQW
jgi:hypothetical protein